MLKNFLTEVGEYCILMRKTFSKPDNVRMLLKQIPRNRKTGCRLHRHNPHHINLYGGDYDYAGGSQHRKPDAAATPRD